LEAVVTWLNHEYVWDLADVIPPCCPQQAYLVHEIAVLAANAAAGLAPMSDALGMAQSAEPSAEAVSTAPALQLGKRLHGRLQHIMSASWRTPSPVDTRSRRTRGTLRPWHRRTATRRALAATRRGLGAGSRLTGAIQFDSSEPLYGNFSRKAFQAPVLKKASQLHTAAIADANLVLGVGDCPIGKNTLGGDLIDLYGKVAKAAPGARIVVTGYPLLFKPPTTSTNPATARITTAINDATAKLNCVIEQAVAASQATYANIYYVDVTKEFARHGFVILAPADLPCTDPNAFIHSLLTCIPPAPQEDPEAFHPMPAGYQAYADATKTKLPSGWLPST
jgi:hypothetical protein